ncbi:hypothetical protein SAMN05444008_10538 [Cnuella takakiae]|uniref:Uncharacterized protein n=1 Tax=Cnuella takakiae TaxID=1302690 RepID=A0A1M4Z0J3_9BACT|nr:glycoside hydrolase family 127 protein [Cnuella takakiae]OLY94373.1 glycosyl hydrolase [Cnuella takakiae]SHF11347.1 hypothetical protein SAMN05444008_10538 [Cnuella takakiae]
MKNIVSICMIALLPQLGWAQGRQLEAFPLSAVRLQKSPFKQAQETDARYMLAMSPDRLLAPYLREAGLESKAAGYGNWEGTGLDGHIGGHYLSALAKMYASTGRKDLNDRLSYMIDWLEKCQQQNGNGYVGGVPGSRQLWADIAAGKINAGSFSLNDKWVPWYNIHKLYAGLVDAYQIAGNQKAKDVLVKLSDWCLDLTRNLSDAQVQNMLRSEHGGMNEVFADVAAITGDGKYLALARRFSHQRILNPLLQGKDSLTGMHANTQIPKVIGYMRVAEVGGDTAWANAANFFWNTVTAHRTVSIGGNSVREHFHPATDFSSMLESKEGPETCNSYNMLKLTRQLFLANYAADYMDYYERTLYNHILSSQHPKGGFVYFTPMRPRHYRVYSQPDQGFWCCVGSGIENHGKYGELIYAHKDKDLFVNLFIPSTLSWKERGIQVVQSGKFPFEERSQLTLTLSKPQQFTLFVRQPSWVKKGGMKIRVNNKDVPFTTNDASYAGVSRMWKSGDVVTISLPMETRSEKLPDGSNWVSFTHGPVVLAAATDTTGLQGLRADDSRMGHIANGPLYAIEDAPLLVSSQQNLEASLMPVKGKPLAFTASSLIYPQQYKNLELVPFFQIHDARYMIYWPVTTSDSLALRQKAIQEREKTSLALEAQTIDQVAPGEQQPESDHGFKGEKTESGVFRDRHWRHATGGWFSYDLKDSKKASRKLRITYYGGDKDRTFDILVNDTLLQTVVLNGNQGNNFYEVDYDLPQQLVQNSGGMLQVKFAAHPGSVAGGIYYVRLMK